MRATCTKFAQSRLCRIVAAYDRGYDMASDDEINAFLDAMGDDPPSFVELGDDDQRTWEQSPTERTTLHDEAARVAEAAGDQAVILHFHEDVVCLGRRNKSGQWRFLILDGDDRFPVDDLFEEG